MRLTKFKSLFASLLCGALVLSAAGLSTHAADGVQKVQLKLTSVEIELTPEVEMVRSETENSATIELIDKQTGEVTTSYSEVIEEVIPASGKGKNVLASDGTYTIVTTKKERKDGPVNTQLSAKLKIYTNGSFKQINSIESTKMKITNSNSATLEDKDVVAISTTDKFPTHTVEISGSATITYTSTNSSSASGSFSASALTAAGFEVSYTGSKEWEYYARKAIEMGLRYSVK